MSTPGTDKLTWVHENPPHWDDSKTRIIGRAPQGVFNFPDQTTDALLPGEWWRVESAGSTVGFGWMDCTWGNAEILLAVDPAHQGQGIGAFILEQLELEASARGLRYMFNIVAESHPDREAVNRWLTKHGFEPSHDSDRLMRRIRAGA